MKDKPYLPLAAIALAAALIGSGWMLRGCHDAPPKPPAPVVVPDEPGPRDMLIVYESADETPEQSAMFITLRKDETADALKAAGHSLLILDTNATNEKNEPAAALTKHKAEIDSTGPPCLIISDHKSGKVLSAEKLPASADAVLASLKAHGG